MLQIISLICANKSISRQIERGFSEGSAGQAGRPRFAQMVFNSFEFLLLFLPATVLGFALVARFGSRTNATVWLACASLVFYASAETWHVAVMSASILFNFFLGVQLAQSRSRRLMWIGIGANLLLLTYFKYTGFLVDTVTALTGAEQVKVSILLPAGVSFFTFTQIAFLVDATRGETREVNLPRYVLFVTFFPHLIAGPIIHHREMIPQFATSLRSLSTANLAIGLSIFLVGLAKKILLADNIAPFATPIFSAADGGLTPTSFEAWAAAVAFSLRLYFDFSGYSDMAIGLSRIFGILLPLNFRSPYKAPSIVEFWRRWHMTLSRFLRDYLYIPLGGSRSGAPRHYLALVATMGLGGLWHGASWNFLIWGLMHAGLLILNRVWSDVAPAKIVRLFARVSIPLVFVAVTIAWVPFASETVAGMGRMYVAMFALDGVTFPAPAAEKLGQLGHVMTAFGVRFDGSNVIALEDWRYVGLPVLVLGLAIVWGFPNTQEIFRDHRPALAVYRGDLDNLSARVSWRPSWPWALAMAGLAAACLLHLHRVSEFIYFRF